MDGVPLPDEEARAFWRRFSDFMEENRGDLAGFAKKEGFASVHPGVDDGGPVLYASRSEAQKPYGPASRRGGSGARHGDPRSSPGKPRNQRKSR